MKPVKEVEKDRISYYKNSNLNTVHRSSLLIPRLEGHQTYISLVNHYFIKRNYKNVILKLTAYDQFGISSDSISYELKFRWAVGKFIHLQLFKIKWINCIPYSFLNFSNEGIASIAILWNPTFIILFFNDSLSK